MDCSIDSTKLKIPMPAPIVIREIGESDESKIKYYTETEKVPSICAEFQKLNNAGYTHVANMPGPISEILYYANKMKLVVLDHRMLKHVSDLSADTVDDDSNPPHRIQN